MARTRFRRKDLKRPDEFVSRGRQLLRWGGENTRLLSRVGGALALVIVAVGGFFSVRAARLRQANDDLDRALGAFRAGHYGQAATQLSEVASRWGATTPGRVATLYAASADIQANNFESAVLLLQDGLDARQWPSYLQQQALVNLAYALERKGDAAAAASRYDEASGMQGPYTPSAILGAARCREQLGDRENARKAYERLVREYPQAPEIDVVTAKLAELAN